MYKRVAGIDMIVNPRELQFGLQFTAVRPSFTWVRAGGLSCGANAHELR